MAADAPRWRLRKFGLNASEMRQLRKCGSHAWSLMMAKGTSWSMKELQQAIRMKRRGVTCAEIAVALGRPMDAVEAKLAFCKQKRVSTCIEKMDAGFAIKVGAKKAERSPILSDRTAL